MPMMCDQADLLIKAMKRDVGYGGTTYIDAGTVRRLGESKKTTESASRIASEPLGQVCFW